MTREYIHINDVRKLLNSHAEIGSLKCWKKDGSIMECKDLVCTSSNYEKNTFNLTFLVSGEKRTIKALLIFEVNNKEVIL
ncbi:hypothetical protein [Dysgonomonas sp. HGC4]|uniref:hypothetical protein n=1 Tax=Dysgonomonas sp. HGC4 TaxID=1658009 RepID=UPI0006835D4C|nr:hypothetical protein [Dysgonomonas sp. HGC4]MBD8349343.1 hypothetical protein [Dysgonomonas sp. HGC4]